MLLRGTLFQILAANAAKDRLLSDSLTLKFEIDSIITSTPCSSIVSTFTNYWAFIEISRKKAIYAPVKNSTFVDFTLFIKSYPTQPIEIGEVIDSFDFCSLGTDLCRADLEIKQTRMCVYPWIKG